MSALFLSAFFFFIVDIYQIIDYTCKWYEIVPKERYGNVQFKTTQTL